MLAQNDLPTVQYPRRLRHFFVPLITLGDGGRIKFSLSESQKGRVSSTEGQRFLHGYQSNTS